MKEITQKPKNVMIELWRFVFMMVITLFHFCGNCRYALNEGETFWFRTGFIYVEFFFMLTGFLTAKHFDGKEYDEKEGLKYCLNKIVRFYPPYLVVVLISAALSISFRNLTMADVREKGFSLLINMLMLSTAYSPDGGRNILANPPQVWYLSALFLALPLVCFFLCSKYKFIYSRYISLLVFILYYGRVGFVERAVWPSDLMRGLVSMGGGVFLYEITRMLNKNNTNRSCMYAMMVTGNLLMICTAYLTFLGDWNALPLVVIFFSAGIVSLNVSQGRSEHREYLFEKVIYLCGNLSFYIFLAHFVVIIALNRTSLVYQLGRRTGALIYLVMTILFSLFLYLIDMILKKCLFRRVV